MPRNWLDFLNIPAQWPYTKGQGVRVAVLDEAAGSIYAKPVNYEPTRANYHAQGVAYIIHGIAPDAEIYGINVLTSPMEGMQAWGLNKALRWCMENGVDLVNMSVQGFGDPENVQAVKEATEAGIILVACAGNTEGKGVTYPGRDPNVIPVAAYWPVVDRIAVTDAVGPEIFITFPTAAEVPAPWGGWTEVNATSGATPHCTGSLALYISRSREVNGRKPTLAECRAFLIANAKDLLQPGRDEASGYGLFKFPGPETWPEKAEKEEARVGRVIVLDPGHGGRDPGAVGPRGLQEKSVALAVAKRLQAYLNWLDFGDVAKVILTRDKDMVLGATVNEDLAARVAIAEEAKADLFISIHCNSAATPEAQGMEVYSSPGQTEADDLAEAVIQSLVEAFPEIELRTDTTDGDRDKEANYYVLRETTMPAILVELAFISNPEEEKMLADPISRDKFAEAIAAGVKKYLGIRGEPLQPEPSQQEEAGGDTQMATVIELWIGKNVAKLNGEEVTLDQAPEVDPQTNRSLMPVRFVAESLGATVEWDGAEEKITIRREG